jgi:hypothetical protein
LHDSNVVDSSTKEFLHSIELKIECTFEIERNIDHLYENCDFSLLLIQTGGSENYFLRDINKIRSPISLLTYGYSNSLAAAIEILSYINQNNLKGEILHGSIDYVSKRILELTRGERND